jgi:hypothetical protein
VIVVIIVPAANVSAAGRTMATVGGTFCTARCGGRDFAIGVVESDRQLCGIAKLSANRLPKTSR